MFTFPLRTSTRYPGGLDPQTLGKSIGRRQTKPDIWPLGMCTQLGTGWVQHVDWVWTHGASQCVQREDDPDKQGSD